MKAFSINVISILLNAIIVIEVYRRNIYYHIIYILEYQAASEIAYLLFIKGGNYYNYNNRNLTYLPTLTFY